MARPKKARKVCFEPNIAELIKPKNGRGFVELTVDIKATTEYSTHIHASVEKGNLFACQFHPEKSSDLGLAILKNFAEIGEED